MKNLDLIQLLKDNETDLERIRHFYIPKILPKKGEDRKLLITGYNIYLDTQKYPKGGLFLNYLHSDLKNQDRHYLELIQKFKEEGFSLDERVNINHRLIDNQNIATKRDAYYKTIPEFEDPEEMRYFNEDGEEISKELAKKEGKVAVGESLQYDLLIQLKDENELNQVTGLFIKYANEFLLNSEGDFIQDQDGLYISNKDAIFNAWKIPLLIHTDTRDIKINLTRGFTDVNQFNISEYIGKQPVTLSTLIKKRQKDFEEFLRSNNKQFIRQRKYVSKLFIKEYVDKEA
ncbi:MAG: hypothetical protein PHE43_04160 [Candidatus Nanoarchaeia archaeon]|nr:hypothetical protein [Candidatus Nanoarchaeia archaeon]